MSDPWLRKACEDHLPLARRAARRSPCCPVTAAIHHYFVTKSYMAREGAVDHGHGPVYDNAGACEQEQARETADACASWGTKQEVRVRPASAEGDRARRASAEAANG